MQVPGSAVLTNPDADWMRLPDLTIWQSFKEWEKSTARLD
jgi:hypothetical protein